MAPTRADQAMVRAALREVASERAAEPTPSPEPPRPEPRAELGPAHAEREPTARRPVPGSAPVPGGADTASLLRELASLGSEDVVPRQEGRARGAATDAAGKAGKRKTLFSR